jgi:hypothetical protein
MDPVPAAGTRTGRRTTLMPAALPPGLNLARLGQPLAHALTVAVLAVPLVIVAVALFPAFVICPFLDTARRQQVTGLLASLQQWTATLTGPGQPHTDAQGATPGIAQHRDGGPVGS